MIIKGYMMPHPPIAVSEIGRGEEEKCRMTLDAFARAADEIASLKPELIILFSPHAVMYRDWFDISSGTEASGDFSAFRCPDVSMTVSYDTEWIDTLEKLLPPDFPAGTQYHRERELDHGTMVPLYFVRRKYTDFRVVRIGLSGLSAAMHYRLGMYVKKACELTGRRTVVIASGDLSHCQKKDGPYGFRSEGPEYDEKIMAVMGNADFYRLFEFSPAFLGRALECGHRSFLIMAGAFDRTEVTAEVMSHEAPFGVGYGIISFTPQKEDNARCFLEQYEEAERKKAEKIRSCSDPLVQLAWKAVENTVKGLPAPEEPPELQNTRAGVFVSIHEAGELRGCIGTFLPAEENIAREIIRNARSACTRDPRFPAIGEEELPYLEITVDVLGKPERIGDEKSLDVRKYGVICSTADGRRGLLLPDLEGVDTPAQQIRIACRKGGISPDTDDVILERFEAVRHV